MVAITAHWHGPDGPRLPLTPFKPTGTQLSIKLSIASLLGTLSQKPTTHNGCLSHAGSKSHEPIQIEEHQSMCSC